MKQNPHEVVKAPLLRVGNSFTWEILNHSLQSQMEPAMPHMGQQQPTAPPPSACQANLMQVLTTSLNRGVIEKKLKGYKGNKCDFIPAQYSRIPIL